MIDIDFDHIFKLSAKTVLCFCVFVIAFWFGLSGFFLANNFNLVEAFFDGKKNAVIGETSIKIEIADSETERKTGLSNRNELEDRTGMLFVFDDPDYHGIWMKDMQFAIDIIWVNETMNVVSIKENVATSTFPEVFEPKTRSKYVLEVPSGFVEKFGIKKGDLLTLF